MGSNISPRTTYLDHGCRAVAAYEHCELVCCSRVWESAALDCLEPKPFLNAVVLIRTGLAAEDLLTKLQHTEAECRRSRPYPNAPRTLDLDLLLYGENVIDLPDLQVPHPRLAQRRFVLEPLLEVWPDARHPTLGQSIRQLATSARARFPDQQLHPRSGTDPAN